MKQRFEMTTEDLDRILSACKPVRYMVFAGRPPSSPQENANAAWAELGRRMGFDPMSVEPPGSDDPQTVFLAEPVAQKVVTE